MQALHSCTLLMSIIHGRILRKVKRLMCGGSVVAQLQQCYILHGEILHEVKGHT